MDEDRRRGFRMPVPKGQDQGLLRLKRREVPVRVLDTSSFGFGIVVLQKLRLAEGEVLHLRTLAGWTEVRVVRTGPHEEGTFLGVERLRELSGDPGESGGGMGLTALAAGLVALVVGVVATVYWPRDPEKKERRKTAEVVSMLGQKAQETWQRLRN